MTSTDLERDIEAYFVKRAQDSGCLVRKVQWIGRAAAPDRICMGGLMFRPHPNLGHDTCDLASVTLWVELKNPETIKTFPANAHERAQAREHERMRKAGQWVEVIGTREHIDRIFE